ncbi:unnamed protein product [Caenorhabditis sp. 36 PRJEB53466]|nr:unnamed protein product [Caenorhabditis sp. 36 PRJEB53466]
MPSTTAVNRVSTTTEKPVRIRERSVLFGMLAEYDEFKQADTCTDYFVCRLGHSFVYRVKRIIGPVIKQYFRTLDWDEHLDDGDPPASKDEPHYNNRDWEDFLTMEIPNNLYHIYVEVIPPKRPYMDRALEGKFNSLLRIISADEIIEQSALIQKLEEILEPYNDMHLWQEYDLKAEAGRKVYAREVIRERNRPINRFKAFVWRWINDVLRSCTKAPKPDNTPYLENGKIDGNKLLIGNPRVRLMTPTCSCHFRKE